MAISKEVAMTLIHGTVIFSGASLNADKTPARARVNGMLTRKHGEWALPMKHGLRDHFYLTEENCWFTSESEALLSFHGFDVKELGTADPMFVIVRRNTQPIGEEVTERYGNKTQALSAGLAFLLTSGVLKHG